LYRKTVLEDFVHQFVLRVPIMYFEVHDVVFFVQNDQTLPYDTMTTMLAEHGRARPRIGQRNQSRAFV
jgi:hypothetical protein